MKPYVKPSARNLEIGDLKVIAQGGSQFTLSGTGAFNDDDCGAGEQGFHVWLIGPIEAGATIQVQAVGLPIGAPSPDPGLCTNLSDNPDLVLRVLDANNSDLTGCIDANGIGGSESTSFTAPNTGTYEIHVHGIESGGGTCSGYTLTVSGDQAQPTTFNLQQNETCPNDCAHAPIS